MDFEPQNDEHTSQHEMPLSEQELIDIIEKNTRPLANEEFPTAEDVSSRPEKRPLDLDVDSASSIPKKTHTEAGTDSAFDVSQDIDASMNGDAASTSNGVSGSTQEIARDFVESSGYDSQPSNGEAGQPQASWATAAKVAGTTAPPAQNASQSIRGVARIRSRTLPVIDNLASQILDMLSNPSYHDTLSIVTEPDSDLGEAFQMLLSLFEKSKLAFTKEPFLSVHLSGLADTRPCRLMVQRVNLTTFLLAVFSCIPIGFYHLNDSFLSVFVPEGGRILKPQAGLYLDLKTQAYISAMRTKQKTNHQVMAELFPEDIEQQFLASRSDRASLSPSETEFIARCQRRRQRLLEEPSVETLASTYEWLSFLKDMAEYVAKNHKSLIPPLSEVLPPMFRPTPNVTFAPAGEASPRDGKLAGEDFPSGEVASAATDLGAQSEEHGSSDVVYAADTMNAYRSARRLLAEQNGGSDMRLDTGSSYVTKPSGSFYTRRPWTKEEEEALVEGLDRVQGPHWSQILELYGPGGSISEVLKDRSQVQLKDKARNMKMFFFKCGLPVPAVFQKVTGNVETRMKKTQDKSPVQKQGATPADASQQPSSGAAVASPHVAGPLAAATSSDDPFVDVTTDRSGIEDGAAKHVESGPDTQPNAGPDPQSSVEWAGKAAQAAAPVERSTSGDPPAAADDDAGQLERLLQTVGDFITQNEPSG